MTRRQEITNFLKGEGLSLQDLSVFLKVHIREILEDVPHIEKSVQPEEKLTITSAQCQKCGFIFKGRRSISRTPKKTE